MTTTTLRRDTVAVPRPRLQTLMSRKEPATTLRCVTEHATGDPWQPSAEAWRALRVLWKEWRDDPDILKMTLTMVRE